MLDNNKLYTKFLKEKTKLEDSLTEDFAKAFENNRNGVIHVFTPVSRVK